MNPPFRRRGRSVRLLLVTALLVLGACMVAGCMEERSMPQTNPVVRSKQLEVKLAAAKSELKDAEHRARTAAETAEQLQQQIDEKPADEGDLEVVLEDPYEDDEAAYQLLDGTDLLDDDIDAINEQVALPQDIELRFASDVDGPQYDGWENEVTFPYWFVSEVRSLVADSDYADDADVDEVTIDMMRFVLAHEVAHALIDQLHLPVLGREEDAADTFAVVLAIDILRDGEMAIAGGDFFNLTSAQRKDAPDVADYWDTHSLDEQRFYMIQCLAYGGDSKRLAHAVEGLGIDEDRLGTCQFDWFEAKLAWQTVLAPHEIDD